MAPQVQEIVGHEAALMYATDDEAVETITRVMDSAAEQARLREWLASTSEQFSTTQFVRQVRDIVDTFKE